MRVQVRYSEEKEGEGEMNIGWAVIISMYYAAGSTSQVSYDALGPKDWTRLTSKGFLAALKTIEWRSFLLLVQPFQAISATTAGRVCLATGQIREKG
jgi:hypothetical protein